MPYLLSRTKATGAQFEKVSKTDRRDISELIGHGAAADNDADPEDEGKGGAEFRSRRRPTRGIPLRHSRIKQLLIRCRIDPEQQQEDQLRAEERITVSLAGLSDQ